MFISKGIVVRKLICTLVLLADMVDTRHLMSAKHTLTSHLRCERKDLSSEMPHEENHHNNDEDDHDDNDPENQYIGTELFDLQKRCQFPPPSKELCSQHP